jgi:hypothetical protein
VTHRVGFPSKLATRDVERYNNSANADTNTSANAANAGAGAANAHRVKRRQDAIQV